MAAQLDKNEEGPIAEINIVPFVDIILVVLIIFMVTTPFIMKPSININLPKAASGSDTTPSQLTITIDSDGETFLNGKATEDVEIGNYAVKAVTEKPDIQAIISADKDIPHGRVVSVIDIVKTAGIKKFAITIDTDN